MPRAAITGQDTFTVVRQVQKRVGWQMKKRVLLPNLRRGKVIEKNGIPERGVVSRKASWIILPGTGELSGNLSVSLQTKVYFSGFQNVF